MPKDAAPPSSEKIMVWDAAIRIVHWALVGLIAFSWYSAENHLMDWHRLSGYAIVGLLVFRILWGVIGSHTARFMSFVRGPVAVARYARTLSKRSASQDVGHNPLGAVSVVALLLVTLFQVVTGLYAVDVDGLESGPLSDRISFDQGRWVAQLHETSFAVLQVLIALHIVAILFYLFYKRDNLIGPMITGRRARGNGIATSYPTRMVIAALVAAAVAWFVSNGLRL